uniref:Oxysterol-binding protein n=1 Tax=Solanum tuberosum TaxID=4113 RepID=M1ARD0_SOLTU
MEGKVFWHFVVVKHRTGEEKSNNIINHTQTSHKVENTATLYPLSSSSSISSPQENRSMFAQI